MAKSKPIGVRFDLDILAELSLLGYDTPQKVLNMFFDRYRTLQQQPNNVEISPNKTAKPQKQVVAFKTIESGSIAAGIKNEMPQGLTLGERIAWIEANH
jgi:hypothetical protein